MFFPWAWVFSIPKSNKSYRKIAKAAPELIPYLHHDAKARLKKAVWASIFSPLIAMALLMELIAEITPKISNALINAFFACKELYIPFEYTDTDWDEIIAREELQRKLAELEE